MHNLGVVFQFEYLQQIKKKAFLVTTIILAAVIVFAVLCPVLFRSSFETSGADENTFDGGVFYKDTAYEDKLPFDEDHVYASRDELEQAVRDGDEPVGYVIEDPTHVQTIYANYGVSEGAASDAVLQAMKEIYVQQSLAEQGVSSEVYGEIQSVEIENEDIILGQDTSAQYVAEFVFVIVIYMVIMLYGQMVATNIAREKDSRTMELLITTTRADSLILGKVAAMIAVILTALFVFLLCAAVPYAAVRNQYPETIRLLVSESVNTSLFGVYLLYFLIGLVMYMFLFAALGSVVSKVEDVSSAISPLIMLMLVGYFLAFFEMSGVNTMPVRVLSWVPFFSVLMMPIRYANAAVSTAGLAGSAVVNVLFTCLLAVMSVRIYRFGTLHYGNRIGFLGALKKSLARH